MMLIPAHHEVMNLVYYQAKSIEEVTKIVAARQTPSRRECSTRVINWRSCFAKRA